MIKRKLPQLGVREGRRARSSLRACLEQLRHGGPEAVVAALMGQLRKPSGASGLDEKAADFMIEYTYCVAVRKDPTQEWGVQVYNYVYSDRMLQRGQGARLAPIRRRVWPTGDPGWRLSYSKTAPESEPLNARALQRRLEKQAAYATGPTARRDSVVEKVRKLEAQAARSLAKAGRQQKQVASFLGSSSSSASSDASSSSS